MSLFTRRVGSESRALPESNASWSVVGSQLSGDAEAKALRLAAVYAATSWLADSVATLPLKAYRRGGDGVAQRVQMAVLENPSALGTRVDWLTKVMTSLLLRGNAFGYVVERDSRGYPTSIEWLNPLTVRIQGDKFWVNEQLAPAGDVFHIPAYSVPGKKLGLSPIQAFATTIDTGLYAELMANDWFKNAGTPAQHLKNTERTLDPAQAAEIKERFKASVTSGDAFVTGRDWDLSSLGVSAADAAFLGTMRATATTIAAIYRVPPEKIGGDSGSSLTYNTVEQQSIDFLTHSLRPWLVRLEAAFDRWLLPRGVFCKFNADAIIRPDTLTRMQAHEIANRIGLETIDEARAVEDKPPLTEDQLAAWLAIRQPSSSGGTNGSS